ncbi:BCCT family transporter [Virgibacillus salexigens]|uniref:Glycine betaine transporter OpuD n=2 Tax=Virgibacillus TaxID=84406 RepID=A0A024Q795_9BACI|nr:MULTISPECIES: BCCT family transporter [Virgibacillus]MYL41037.1 BCCT family transporter [Virgibacillus massiliensis]GGJ53771.1 transporter [Virgibacillus kapii]CDQ38162.1 Glycine betaine transporter OpuD [Virgibacillus massiliensis]
MKSHLIDWRTFVSSLILLLLVCIPLIIYPETGATVINAANDFMTSNFGFLYLALGIISFIFLIFVAFSKFGNIKLGSKTDDKEFGTFSWAAMLFAAGIGSSILYWGMIEWAFYYQGPPFGITPESDAAIPWASSYGIFHWGPIAWAIYTLPALPIAYFYYVRRTSVLKISEAVRPVLGRWVDTPLGVIIDVLFIFGLLGGAGTTLALGTPMIAEGINNLTGIPVTLGLKAVVMLICTLIFAISAYSGLAKGIKVLSDVNLWLAIFVLIFIFIFGPTLFIMETTFTSIGQVADNFFRMATWLEPLANLSGFEETKFPETWTVFYWAWWVVYAPFVGLFVARISRGRTIREMILGTMIYGTFGSILFFGILGNFGLYLQLTGQFDVLGFMSDNGAPAAIIAILEQLPMANIMIGLFTILAIIFLATTFDSSSFILAAVVQKKIQSEPLRWNRLFWAFTLCLLPLVLMFVGDLQTLQTASIVAAFPVIFIMALLGWSFIRAANQDIRSSKQYRGETIHLTKTDRSDDNE